MQALRRAMARGRLSIWMMGITGGVASCGYGYESFSFTAKINGIRNYFLAGCGMKQLKGLVEGFTILWRIRF